MNVLWLITVRLCQSWAYTLLASQMQNDLKSHLNSSYMAVKTIILFFFPLYLFQNAY